MEPGDFGKSSSALNYLTALLHRQLHRLAKRQLWGQRPGHTLRTSDLVNEAYLKLANVRAPDWKDRAHFLSVASRAMRSVLVDYARKRRCGKRGGDAKRISLSDACLFSDQPSAEVVAVDEALARLAEWAMTIRLARPLPAQRRPLRAGLR